jgi:hypothetical protein
VTELEFRGEISDLRREIGLIARTLSRHSYVTKG